MSLYAKDKCSKEELQEFKKTVLDYLIISGIDISKIKMRCQKNYGGNIKILTHKTDIPNNRKSIRKLEDGKYYRSTYSQVMQMGIYFYRSEWEWYNKPEQSDQRKWDLEDIKKNY